MSVPHNVMPCRLFFELLKAEKYENIPDKKLCYNNEKAAIKTVKLKSFAALVFYTVVGPHP